MHKGSFGRVYQTLIGKGIAHEKACEMALECVEGSHTGLPIVQQVAARSVSEPLDLRAIVSDVTTYISKSSMMREVLVRLYKAQGDKPVNKNLWWEACNLVNNHGGRIGTLNKTTFDRYLHIYSYGREQANGNVYWKRKSQGHYSPA